MLRVELHQRRAGLEAEKKVGFRDRKLLVQG